MRKNYSTIRRALMICAFGIASMGGRPLAAQESGIGALRPIAANAAEAPIDASSGAVVDLDDGSYVETFGSGLLETAPSRRFHFEAGAFIMQRTRGGSQVLFVNENSGVDAYSSSAVDLDYAAGPYFTASMQLGERGTVEATYWEIDGWDARSDVFGNNDITLAGPLGPTTADFSDADRVGARSSSDTYTFELNYRLSGGRLAWITGFRFFSLDENYTLTSTDLQSGTSNYNTSTSNRLFGGQVGVVLPYVMGRTALAGFAKVGGYNNDTKQRTLLGDVNDTIVLRNFETSDNTIAVIGEFGITGTYQVTDWVALRGGYRVLLIGGLAIAGEQIDLTTNPGAGSTLHQGGNILMHGAQAGLEFRWGGSGRFGHSGHFGRCSP